VYGKKVSKAPLCSFTRWGWLQEVVLDLLETLTASRDVNIVTAVDMENPG